MVMWTIYERPKDFPELFVARPFVIGRNEVKPMSLCLTGKTLEEVRSYLIPYGMIRLPRDTNDDPCIVETWM